MSHTIEYYRHCTEIELDRAQQAVAWEVVKAHYNLANAYLERISEHMIQCEADEGFLPDRKTR